MAPLSQRGAVAKRLRESIACIGITEIDKRNPGAIPCGGAETGVSEEKRQFGMTNRGCPGAEQSGFVTLEYPSKGANAL